MMRTRARLEASGQLLLDAPLSGVTPVPRYQYGMGGQDSETGLPLHGPIESETLFFETPIRAERSAVHARPRSTTTTSGR